MEDIAQWMASNRLKLNTAKTDFMWCVTAPAQQGPRDIRCICHTAIIDGP